MKKLLNVCTIFCAVLFASCDLFQDPPQLTVESNGQIVAEPNGGECTFTYEILNPKSDGILSVEIPTDSDWVTSPVINEAAKSVTVTLAENPVKNSRNAILTLRYTYGKENVTALVSILQEESAYDYISISEYGVSAYYGNLVTNDSNLETSFIQLSNEPLDDYYDNSYFYAIDLCGDVTDDKLPAPGTYKYSETEGANTFGFTGQSYGEWIGDLNLADQGDPNEHMGFYFIGGEVVVEREGNVYTITATLEDENGKTHFTEFVGELELIDQTNLGPQGYSTLTDDFDLTLSDDFQSYALFYGDGWGIGMNNYTYYFENSEYIIIADVCVAPDKFLEDGFSSITFTQFSDNSTTSDNIFIPGMVQDGYLYGCWLYSEANLTMAPFMEGEITITNNGDNTYNLSLDVMDDLGYNITISGSNIPFTGFEDSYQAGVSGQMSKKADKSAVLKNLSDMTRTGRLFRR